MTKDCTKHVGLLWLPAEKLIITLCGFKTLHSWRVRLFLLEIGKEKWESRQAAKNKPLLVSQVKKYPSWLTGRFWSCQSGAHRTIIISIMKTSCQETFGNWTSLLNKEGGVETDGVKAECVQPQASVHHFRMCQLLVSASLPLLFSFPAPFSSLLPRNILFLLAHSLRTSAITTTEPSPSV